MKNFAQHVVKWFAENGRTHLPWQQNPSPYHVWVSEIMLQQTQVATVIGYYERFIKRFPDVNVLAQASVDDVLHHWAGLGYYARGRNLHKTAQIVVAQHQGHFPSTVQGLLALPGIGRSTAGAIVSLGYHLSATILDGNVKRVLARVMAIESWPDERQTLKQLWELAESLTPVKHVQAYNQAMMDLGAMICTRAQPKCEQCPLTQYCKAFQLQRTDLYPFPRPKKTVPQKNGHMIILMREDGAVLLHQRPSPGIWGGLWCFPERQVLPEAIEMINRRKLGTSRHTFTHYRWEVELEVWEVKACPGTTPDYLWYTADSQPLGLAAIVKRYLPLISEKTT